MGGGANCSIYGCSTSRKNKDVGIFRLPAVKDDLSKKWREELLNVILRDRVLDESLKRQIEKNTLHICQLHFKEDDLYYCKFSIFLSIILFSKVLNIVDLTE